jgi:hypothetical protein
VTLLTATASFLAFQNVDAGFHNAAALLGKDYAGGWE